MNVIDISWVTLALACTALLIPTLIFWRYRTGMTRGFLIAAARMLLQLGFVGLYLGWIFQQNLSGLNVGWALVMAAVATLAVVRRSDLQLRVFGPGVFLALTLAAGSTMALLLGLVVTPDNPVDARYLIPMSGMVLGNCLQSSIIALRSVYQNLHTQREAFLFALGCGATRSEAMRPFMRSALREAFQPMLANLSTIGLVALPGMMTGQILGGSSPVVAVKYQVLIMVAIAVSSTAAALMAILFSRVWSFDAWGLPRVDLHRG